MRVHRRPDRCRIAAATAAASRTAVSDTLPHMVARALSLLGGVALAACSAGDDVPMPAISAIMPDHAAAGVGVTVSGSYLCQNLRTDNGDVDPLACEHVGTVVFDVVPGLVMSYADTTVQVEVPGLAPGRFSVVVSVAGRTSNAVGFVIE